MKKENFKNIIRCLMLLGILSLLLACNELMTTQADHTSKTKEGSMNLAHSLETKPPEIPPIDATAPADFETASFGLGWFWGVESQFGIIEGVIRTRVGYAGGEMSSPTYRHMGDHTETVQVDYDPRRITYAQLLDIFWKSHKPTSQSWSRQYLHAVFYHTAEQRAQALASKAELEKKIGRAVKTEVLPLRSFTMAEGYHQKYTLKRHQALKNEMMRIYPNPRDFVNSTAVSRLNGYAGGNGTNDQLSREIDSLGLSAEGKKQLISMIRR